MNLSGSSGLETKRRASMSSIGNKSSHSKPGLATHSRRASVSGTAGSTNASQGKDALQPRGLSSKISEEGIPSIHGPSHTRSSYSPDNYNTTHTRAISAPAVAINRLNSNSDHPPPTNAYRNVRSRSSSVASTSSNLSSSSPKPTQKKLSTKKITTNIRSSDSILHSSSSLSTTNTPYSDDKKSLSSMKEATSSDKSKRSLSSSGMLKKSGSVVSSSSKSKLTPSTKTSSSHTTMSKKTASSGQIRGSSSKSQELMKAAEVIKQTLMSLEPALKMGTSVASPTAEKKYSPSIKVHVDPDSAISSPSQDQKVSALGITTYSAPGEISDEQSHLPSTSLARQPSLVLNSSSIFMDNQRIHDPIPDNIDIDNRFTLSRGSSPHIPTVRHHIQPSLPSPASAALIDQQNDALQKLVAHLERENNNLASHMEAYKSSENLLKGRIQELESFFASNSSKQSTAKPASDAQNLGHLGTGDSAEVSFLRHKIHYQEQELQSVKKHLNVSRENERKTELKYKEALSRHDQIQSQYHELQMKYSRQVLELKSIMEQNEIMRRENRRLVDSESSMKRKIVEIVAQKEISGRGKKEKQLKCSSDEEPSELEEVPKGNQRKGRSRFGRKQSLSDGEKSENEIQEEVRLGLCKLVEDEIRKMSDAKARLSLLSGAAGVGPDPGLTDLRGNHILRNTSEDFKSNATSANIASIHSPTTVPGHHIDVLLTTLLSLRPILQSVVRSPYYSIVQTLVHGAIGCSSVLLASIQESRSIDNRIHNIAQESQRIKIETERALADITRRYENELAHVRDEKNKLEFLADQAQRELNVTRSNFDEEVKKSTEALHSAYKQIEEENKMLRINHQKQEERKQVLPNDPTSFRTRQGDIDSSPNSPKTLGLSAYEAQILTLRKELETLSIAHGRLKSLNESQERTIEAWKKENIKLRDVVEKFEKAKAEEEANGGLEMMEAEKFKDTISALEAQVEDEKFRNKKAGELIKVLKDQVESLAAEAENLRKLNYEFQSSVVSQEISLDAFGPSLVENQQLKKLQSIIKDRLDHMKQRANRSSSPIPHQKGVGVLFSAAAPPSVGSQPLEVNDMETLMKILKENQETAMKLKQIQMLMDEQTDMIKQLKSEKLDLVRTSNNFETQIKEHKEKSKLREQAWLTKLKTLQRDMSSTKSVYEECEKILGEYERMWRDCKGAAVKAGLNVDVLLNTQETSDISKVKDHPYAFEILYQVLSEQYMANLHNLNHLQSQYEDATKQSENRLMQLETVVENLRVKTESENLMRTEVEKWKMRLEQSENKMELVLNEKKLVDSKLKRIVGGFRSMVGLGNDALGDLQVRLDTQTSPQIPKELY